VQDLIKWVLRTNFLQHTFEHKAIHWISPEMAFTKSTLPCVFQV